MTRRRLLLAASGLLLAVLGGLLWQFRYEIVGPSLKLRIGHDARSWVFRAPDRIQIEPETWTLLPTDGQAVASAEGLLSGLGTGRFLHVAIDATWENVTRKPFPVGLAPARTDRCATGHHGGQDHSIANFTGLGVAAALVHVAGLFLARRRLAATAAA